MVYLLRWVIWLIVILIISIVIHKLLKKRLEGKWIQGFVGVITFIVIVLAPITIAKIAQIYYCYKYQPFYEIVEPLGDDFEGFYYSEDFYKFHKQYPTVKYLDYQGILYYQYPNGYERILGEKDLPNIYNKRIEEAKKEFVENKKETKVYYRTYIDKQGSEYCIRPIKENANIETMINTYNKNIEDKKRIIELREQNKILSPEDTTLSYKLTSTVEDMEYDIEFLKSGDCIARKIIDEREVSKYQLGGEISKDKIIFRIPTILNVEYGNYKNIMNRNTQKTYVVSSHIKAEWNLYGAFDFKDINSGFGCYHNLDLIKMMIENKGK